MQPGHPDSRANDRASRDLLGSLVPIGAEPGQPNRKDLVIDEPVVRVGLARGRGEETLRCLPPVAAGQRDLEADESRAVAYSALVPRPRHDVLCLGCDGCRLLQAQEVKQDRGQAKARIHRLHREHGTERLVPNQSVPLGGLLLFGRVLERHPFHALGSEVAPQVGTSRGGHRLVREPRDRIDVLRLDRGLPGPDECIEVGRPDRVRIVVLSDAAIQRGPTELYGAVGAGPAVGGAMLEP